MPLPNTGHLYGTDPVPTWVQHLAAIEAFYLLLRQGVGQQDETELTIAAGAVTPTGGEHTVDTESDAPSDDLTTVATANFVAGQWLKLRATHTDRTVVVKHNSGGAGKMVLQDAADFALDDDKKWLLLKRVGTDWIEVLRNAGVEPVVKHKTQAWSTDQTATVVHRGRSIVYTGASNRTLAFDPVAMLGDGWFAFVRNDMTAVLTLNPDGSESIDGATTLTLFPGDSATIVCDGTALRTVGLSRPRLARQARTGAGSITTADLYSYIDANGTFELALGAIAGMPAGAAFYIKNTGSGAVTLNPNASEQIDGALTLVLAAGESALVVAGGTAWVTLFRSVSSTIPNGVTIWSVATLLSAKVTVDQPIGVDDTVPGVAEGVAIVTHTHTRPPGAASTNRVRIRAKLQIGAAGGTPAFVLALFKDAETTARHSVVVEGPSLGVIELEYEMVTGGTGNIDFKLRGGVDSGTGYVNADFNGTRLFNTISKSSIVSEEIKA